MSEKPKKIGRKGSRNPMEKNKRKEQRDTKGGVRAAADESGAMKQEPAFQPRHSLSPNTEHNANKASLGPNTKR